jgi:hypothetical protein
LGEDFGLDRLLCLLGAAAVGFGPIVVVDEEITNPEK